MQITLVDAFNTWSSGDKVNEDTFVRILWFFSYKSLIWQIISKTIAFLSSFTIILDIIGEDNIREYADKIDTSFRKINILIIFKKIRQSRLNIFLILLIANFFNFYWLRYIMKFMDILGSYPQTRLLLIFLLICFIIGFIIMNFSIILKKKVLITISVIMWFPFMILILFGLLPTIILVLLLYASNYIFLLSSLILKYTVLFIALVLSLNNFENIVSIVAFGLLILSFSLDLILS